MHDIGVDEVQSEGAKDAFERLKTTIDRCKECAHAGSVYIAEIFLAKALRQMNSAEGNLDEIASAKRLISKQLSTFTNSDGDNLGLMQSDVQPRLLHLAKEALG